MNLGDKIKNLRKEGNLSQEQLAEKLNISRQAISKWESGKAYPDIENLKMLKSIFNITIDELVSDELIIDKEVSSKSGLELEENLEDSEDEKEDSTESLIVGGFIIGIGIGVITGDFMWGTAAAFIGLGVGELIKVIKLYKK